MTAKTLKFDAVPNPRQLLMGHLDAIAKKRAEHQEVAAQHRRLQAFLRAEAEARAKVDAIRQRDVRELAEQLVNPTSLHIAVDHCAQSEAESELSRARREADVARACEPAVAERITESSRQIAAFQQRTILLVAEIMIEEAQTLAAEINVDAKRLRAKYARLGGLRRHIGDTPPIRKKLDDLPLPTHPDHIIPDIGELMAAADAWRGYAARLTADPDAELKE